MGQEMSRTVNILIIFSSCILLVSGQVLWKIGLNKIGPFSLFDENIHLKLYQIFTNYLIILGLIIFAIATILWFQVLSQVELSTAYPIMSLSYVIGVLIGIFFFNESLELTKILGLTLIVIGIFFLSRSI